MEFAEFEPGLIIIDLNVGTHDLFKEKEIPVELMTTNRLVLQRISKRPGKDIHQVLEKLEGWDRNQPQTNNA